MNLNILHICSINTNGLQQSEKRQRLIEWSKQRVPDNSARGQLGPRQVGP